MTDKQLDRLLREMRRRPKAPKTHPHTWIAAGLICIPFLLLILVGVVYGG